MGYYASGSGSVILKEGIKAEEIVEKIDKYMEEKDIYWDGDIDAGIGIDGKEIIDFWESDDHWHGENTEMILNFFNPYIESGSANYSGDEDCHWRYTFDAESNKWIEENGRVDYNLESYSDDELIAALRSRGYVIERGCKRNKYGCLIYIDVLTSLTKSFTQKDFAELVADQINQGDPVWESILEDIQGQFDEDYSGAVEDNAGTIPIENYISVNMESIDIDYSETAAVSDPKVVVFYIPFEFDIERVAQDYPEINLREDQKR